ncbi:sensor histidine kinase [Bacillus sp. Au-Bac7]|uniref:sensor histidine kinase n=1 Tax=Bacillus sp. Au-Bac7 TaxID=2906458 RepID=UPI001E651139|nr:ATP-binding protein [Bacillus sp. Au-Bac7]MCE4050763.1 HAMP domain-containing histidine kinase [Bacillus sp. Au-Bac7]
MKAKIASLVSIWKGRNNQDIFKSTQYRLTALYSGLLMLFLLLFIIVVYLLLYFTIFKEQERELKVTAEQEASSIEAYLTQTNQTNLLEFQNQKSLEKDVDQFFFYVVNTSGSLVLGDETVSDSRSEILNKLDGWDPSENEIRSETIKVDNITAERRFKTRGRVEEFESDQKQETVRLLVAAQPIYHHGQEIGLLYIGKEISFAYQLFKMLPFILLGIAVLFMGVAIYISYYMSKKAMIPISRTFARQKEFVADASHELRTPLSVMLSSINAMEMTAEFKEEDYSHKLLLNMKNEVKRMTGLVGDLLTIARSDMEKIELANETFDFCPLAKKTIQSLKMLADSKQIKLYLHAPEALIVHGDSQRFTQLLYILVDNAIKYTPNGGEVLLSLAADGRELVVEVKDTGIGIDPKDQQRIFDRFYRTDKSRTRQVGGHGLGLSIAKWIVDSYAGTIHVSSEIGKGSVFSIRIPIQKENDK